MSLVVSLRNFLLGLGSNERRGWGVLALYAVISRLPLLAYQKACDDEQVYAVVAIEMLHGGRPYIDAVERKPPLLFYVYEWILRIGGEHNYFALHAACLLWLLATMAAIYIVARRWNGPPGGFVAAALFAVFSAWGDYTNLAFNGEILMNLPVAAALAITFRETRSRLRFELIAAGSLVALAFLLKQPSVVAIAPLGLYVLHREYKRQRGLRLWEVGVHLLMLGLGFVATLLASAYWLHQVGILQEAWYWTVGNHANPMGPTTWFFWHKLPAAGTWFVLESIPLLLLAGYSLYTGFRSTREGPWRAHPDAFFALAVLLLLSAWGVGYNGQFNLHYFLQLAPALSLLAAPVAVELLLEYRRPTLRVLDPKLLVSGVLVLAGAFLVVDTIGLSRNRGPQESAVFVKQHTTSSDRIFMWGQGTRQTGLYLDAERRPASRYIASFPLNGLIFGLAGVDTSHRIVPGAWSNLQSEFERHPPKFIIDCHEVRDGRHFAIRDYPYLRDLLATQYRLVLRARDGVVYQRVDTES